MSCALQELSERMLEIYGDRLKTVILYGSVARGTDTEGSDVDVMVLIDGSDRELRQYDEQLGRASSDLSLRYFMVFSIIDVQYREFMDWKTVLPFYRNVDREGIVLYAA